ncbi:O-antigen ligase family protein [Jiella sp. M17.18]|uniref:O-antigen ligase family protein n=1 Tax=Jiella sp. M17.18 TaxID=3234247 RepID=UPI0034DFA2C5
MSAVTEPSLAPARTARSFHDRYFCVVLFAIAAYAMTGKGFAYAGIPPIFPGEMILAAGLLTFAWPRPSPAVFFNLPHLILIAMIGWVLFRTIPFIGVYKVDALRDSVIVVYGLYALIVANLILEKPSRIDLAVGLAGRFFSIYGFCLLWLYITQSVVGSHMPVWPVSEAPFLVVRGGEAAVHLSAAAVFALLGLKRFSPLWILMLLVSVAFISAISRGGMLSIVIPVFLAAVLSGRIKPLLGITLVMIPVITVLYVTDVEISVPQTDRTITVSQVVDNTISIVGSSETKTLDGTKEWRLRWWNTIVDYTFHGPYFWTGKGFGINLAEADGFNLTPGQDSSLRSPHNGNMTILARAGIPGLILWIALNGSWVAMMLRSVVISRLRGHRNWSSLFIFVLCYMLAALIDASFDVALEGPMIGIVFWVMIGFGVALTMTYRQLSSGRRDGGQP